MSELNLISPLLDGLKLLEQFSERGGTRCYYLENPETGEQFVLKHISIPESETKTQALILTGAVADEAAANEYYETLAEDLRSELIRLQSFHEHGGVAAWTDFQIEAREGVGFDVYMLMPRKTALNTYLKDKAFTHLQALNLGIDLCDALGTMREAGYTYQNLKPENVFVDAKNHFTIGDLGLMPLKDLKYTAVPENYLNLFSAPELSRLIPEPDKSSDVYSLGMLLFYIFNGNHLPFEDEKTPPEKAAAKRQEARALPTPVYADYELAEIISVACSLEPKERYTSPAELKQALTLYMQRNEISDQLLVPPLNEDSPEAPVEKVTEAPPEPQDDASEVPEEAPEEPAEDPEPDEAAEEPEANLPEEPGEEPDALDAEPEEQPEPAPDEAEAPPEEQPEAETDTPEEDAPAESEGETIDELLASVNDVLGEEEAPLEAPDIEANEEAVKEAQPDKRKKRVWIPILIALLALALLGAAIAYFYTNWYLVTMEKVEVIDRTADSITVAYQLSSPDPDLSWDCIDTYGNSYSGIAGTDQVMFRDLEPGTQYTVRFYPGKLHKLLGETTASAATAAMTQIVSMTATQSPEKTTAEIALVVSGPEPEQWLLTYSSSGSDSGSLFFTGHNAEVVGLKLNETYTFELKAVDEVYLDGQTDCTLTMVPDVQISDFHVSAATDDSLTVTWESLADAPQSWTVRCVGPSYDVSQDVTQCAATFRGVRLKESYTFSLSTPFSSAPVSITLPANAKIITSLRAEALDAGTVQVDWACTDPQPENGWVVRYQVGSVSGSVSAAEENTAILSGLPANTEIAVTLEPAGGGNVIGVRSCTAETPVAPNFGSHEFSIDDSSLRLYALPDQDDWTYDDLGDSAEAFDPEAEIAVVLQGPEEFNLRDTEETGITLVIRDQSGGVSAYRTVSSTWNDIWNDGRYLTTFKLPATPGKYQVELYFDSQFVNRQVFTVNGEAPDEG